MSSDKPTKIKTKNVNLKLAPNVQADQQAFFFNRFHIDKTDEAYYIFLGTILDGELFNSHAIVMFKADVQNCYQSSKAYIGALSTLSLEAPKDWARPRAGRPVLVANILNLAKAGEVGELLFTDYRIHEFATMQRSSQGEIPLARVLVTRSTLNLHRQFLGHLFHGLS